MLTHVPLGQCLIANLSGDAVAAVTPGRAGGEPIRFLGFRRGGASAPTVISAVATEYIIDLLVLVTGAAVLTVVAARQVNFLGRLTGWMSSPRTWLIITIVLASVTLAIAALQRTHPHHFRRLIGTLRGAWHKFRQRPPGVLVRCALCTLASFCARAAILPVLLASVPGIPFISLVLGGAAVFYLYILSPTPGGVGIVEIGIISGLKGRFTSAELTRLIILWRVYAFALGALLGAAFLVRNRIRRKREGGTQEEEALKDMLRDVAEDGDPGDGRGGGQTGLGLG